MLLSTLTTKGQATIPSEIREELKLKPGDKIIFAIKNHTVILAKAEPLDYLYHASISHSLNEWNTSEDDDAYHNL